MATANSTRLTNKITNTTTENENEERSDNSLISTKSYNGILNVHDLMPASWTTNVISTDEDPTQWYGDNNRQGFDNYIASANAAPLVVNRRTAINRQVNAEINPDIRQSLLNDAKSVYPFLMWQ